MPDIFNLPDLGEGLLDAEITEWYVKEGDIIEIDAPLVSMETAKAIVDVPSPVKGKVLKLFGHPGDIIGTGEPLVQFEILSGNLKTSKDKQDSGTVVGTLQIGDNILKENEIPIPLKKKATKATPLVRALARRLNVDLSMVVASGPDGTITSHDVEQFSTLLKTSEPLEYFRGVRRTMAETMTFSHREVVSVTVVDDAKLYRWKGNEDITVRVIGALVEACRREPSVNAWYDSELVGRRTIKELHLGIAMDTPDGLFVPVLKNAQALEIKSIRENLNQLKEKVSKRNLMPDEFKGATFTLSNFGKFGGRYANPVIVPPTVAILGVGSVREDIVALEGKAMVCKVMPLSLSFDHRALTGGEATRFLGYLIQELEK